jgi:hypothetical protein
MSGPALRDLTKPLLAFWVGDDDVFAAEDEAQAVALANAMVGIAGVWALEDVEAVTADTLDERAAETVRGLLARQDKPGYLVGFEQ